jgi:hypothetical protein
MRQTLINLPMIDLPTTGFFQGWEETAYGGTTALRNKDPNATDQAYKAFTSVSSAFNAFEPSSEGILSLIYKNKVKFKFPVVVADCPIYVASLKENKLIVEECSDKAVRLIWKGEGSNGRTLIDIVNIKNFDSYLSSVKSEFTKMSEKCIENPDLMVPFASFSKMLRELKR